jgi:anti-anti-sigma factor
VRLGFGAVVAALRVDLTMSGTVPVLALSGDLDLAAAGVLERALEEAHESAPAALVVDLRGVDFMDSSGLRVVVTAAQRAEEDARRFALVRGKAQVMRVFEITRMLERLDFVDDPATAAGRP